MVAIGRPPELTPLPDSDRERLRAIRDAQLRDIREAVNTYARPIRTEANALIDLVDRVQDNPALVLAAIRAFHVKHHRRLAGFVANMVENAATVASRYDELINDFGVRARRDLPGQPRGPDPRAIAASEVRFRTTLGAPGASAAVARARLGTRPPQRAGIPQRFPGDAEALRRLRPFRGTPAANVSERLHGRGVATSREASRVILRGIQESQSLDVAARELIQELKKKGLNLAENQQVPRLIRELKASGTALARRADDPAARAAWRKTLREIDRFQKGLLKGGTVQNAYLELLQNARKFGPERVGQITDNWTYWKTRQQAERWIRTESAVAYRSAQAEKDQPKPWVVGYRWNLTRAVHSRYTRRLFGKKGRRGRIACVCEHMDGKIISKETLAEYPGGGHPHCSCWFEPIVDRSRMTGGFVSREEDERLGL